MRRHLASCIIPCTVQRPCAAALVRARDFSSDHASSSDPVLVDGVRTPFLTSLSDFDQLDGHRLLTESIRTLLTRTQQLASVVDHVAAGCAYQDQRVRNVAREAAISAGLPPRCHSAQTVVMACVSSLAAAANCAALVTAGTSQVAVAAGVEFMSDAPIR